MSIDQIEKKYTANDKRVFSQEEVESRLDHHGPPIGKEGVLEKVRTFLSEQQISDLKTLSFWIVESEEGLGATYLLEELSRFSSEKGVSPIRWSLYQPQFPSEECFVWLVDDLTKAVQADSQEKLFNLASKLKEMIHRQEHPKGWIVLLGLHKFSHLPEDLQSILRGRSKRLQLLPWKSAEMEKYLRDVFQTDEIPPFLSQILEKEGGGNPKRFSLLLKLYLEKKLLFDRRGHWKKELFHPNRLFTEEFGEGGGHREGEALFQRLGPDEKKMLFFLASLYEPAPLEFIKAWMHLGFVPQHLHRLKSLGALGGGDEGPYSISRSGFKGFLLEQLGVPEVQKLHDQLLEFASRPENAGFFSAEALHFHQAQGSDPESSAKGWAYFGNLSARRGLSQSAYEYFTKAHDRTPSQNTEKRFEYALERGKCLIAGNRFPEAKAFFESLVVGYAPQKEKKPAFFSKIDERLGLLEMKRGRLKEARGFFEKALTFLEPEHEPLEQYLGVRNFLASLDMLEGDYPKAIQEFQRNHERALKELPWERRRVLTNNDLGEALLKNKQGGEAIAHWEACIEDLKKREDQNPLVRCYYQLSLAHQEQGDEERAFVYLLEAAKALKGLQNLEMELRVYNALANLKKHRDPEKALECYEKALECAFHAQDPYSTAVVLLNMGFWEIGQNNWDKVRHCLSQAIAYLEAVKGQDAQIPILRHSALLGLAKASLELHDPQESLLSAKKAMALAEKHPELSEERFETLFLLHRALKLSGKDAEATRCLRLLEKIAKTSEDQQRLKEII